MWKNIIYNQLLKEATFEGRVLEVKEGVVKIHLDTDEKGVATASSVKDKIKLYFKNGGREEEKEKGEEMRL